MIIRKTVLTIPEELMLNEALRCQKRISMRVDDKCIVGFASEEWAEIKKQQQIFEGNEKPSVFQSP